MEPLWRTVVGAVLRAERRRQGRTLRQVADAAGISVPYLSEVERGRKEASSEILAAAARALDLRLVDLLHRAYGLLDGREVRVVSTHLAPVRSTVGRSTPTVSAGPALLAA